MSMRTRALVFSTFFGSCIAIGLLLVSLTTNHWVRAYPKRLNYTNSSGDINFGLFYGNKALNYGVGVRSSPIIVYTFDQNGPETMNFWLWLITALGTGFGLLSCAISAIAAVLKAASAGKRPGTMILLFASNISSAASQVVAFICWLVQFYQYLQHNVLAAQDRNWYSHGLAFLGYSFYLVIASTLVVIINIFILLHAKRSEQRDRQRLEPLSEEKNQGAIMLY
ncbi:clarin-2 [Eurosta solidaginis]|uniref:clarin-2 n=1 Tax=Eurosta solidaginis TaxID=178769 RepID=UPI003530AA74